MTGTRSGDAQFAQHQQHHIHKAVEGEVHVLLGSDERQHQIVHIGIDAASPTLPSVETDAVLTAISHVHLVLEHLIPPEDDTRLHLPHEERIGLVGMARHELLHRQIE